MARATRSGSAGRTPARSGGRRATGIFDSDASTDRISRYLQGKSLVPAQVAGSDRFLDIVSWNIRYFDHKDPQRVRQITEVLDALNGDMFVLVEIAADGALEEVVNELARRHAGYYSVKLGTTGAQQRVALVWDRDWVRAKKDPIELFATENLTALENGVKKDVFPRLPLWGFFEATSAHASQQGFTFELVGVHLKAQGGGPASRPEHGRQGIAQRQCAAGRLAKWLVTPEEHYDTDVLIIGDWNAAVNEPEWDPLRALEATHEIAFTAINDPDKPTHLVRLNKSGPAGTRLDVHVITTGAMREAVPGNAAIVINWKPFDDLPLLASGDRLKLMKAIRQRFSDHLPVVSRFYLAGA